MTNIDFSKAITAVQSLASAKEQIEEELAHLRWRAEVGGLVMEGGIVVRTDRETRAALTEAVNAIRAGLMQGPVPWKMASGWADLAQEDLEAMTSAVARHVQNCFAAERTVQAQVDALENPAGFDPAAAFEAALNALETPT